MTRSRKILALVGAVLVLALAGCVRFQADLSVDENDLLDGDIIVAVITDPDDPASEGDAMDAVADIEGQLLPELRGSDGVTAESYTDDDCVGTKFSLRDTPIEALNGADADGALTLTRLDDEFEFTGTLDFTPDDEQLPEDAPSDPGDGGIEVSITFPGEVLEHNGELTGTTVTWSISLEDSVTMQARASAIPTGAPLWLWGAAAVAALLIALAVIIVVGRRRKRVAP